MINWLNKVDITLPTQTSFQEALIIAKALKRDDCKSIYLDFNKIIKLHDDELEQRTSVWGCPHNSNEGKAELRWNKSLNRYILTFRFLTINDTPDKVITKLNEIFDITWIAIDNSCKKIKLLNRPIFKSAKDIEKAGTKEWAYYNTHLDNEYTTRSNKHGYLTDVI